MKKKFIIRFPNGETLEDGIIVDQEDALEAIRCLSYMLNNPNKEGIIDIIDVKEGNND